MTAFSHCPSCGHSITFFQLKDDACSCCGEQRQVPSLVVVLVVLPIGEGLLSIRRGMGKHAGILALPGGRVEPGESWQQAAARELVEETGVEIQASAVRLLEVQHENKFTLIFTEAPAFEGHSLPQFDYTIEVAERVIVHAPEQLGFPLHRQVAQRHFERVTAWLR